ncbi:butyrophilin subfamily 1 member A1-like [Urocitellus parryii]
MAGPGVRHLTPASDTKMTDGDGLFGMQTFITVDKSSRAIVSCFTRNTVLNTQKGVCVSLAEGLFPSSCTWMVVLAVLISVLILAAAICAVFLLARKDKVGEDRNVDMSGLLQLQKEILWGPGI